MDVYNQLQEKLNDITHRFAHEARYFQLCSPPEALAGEEVHEAPSKPPFEETKESLLERAKNSAHAIVALNVQVEQLLGTLPADDVGEQEQLAVLEALIRENKEASWRLPSFFLNCPLPPLPSLPSLPLPSSSLPSPSPH
eukprot:415463-Hanusia_phi.AAC.2